MVTAILSAEDAQVIQTFWQNLYLRGQTLHDADGQITMAYLQPSSGLPFSRGYIIDAQQHVVTPLDRHQPQNVIDTIYQLLADLPLPGDVDGDGVVGVTDLLSLLAAWGPCPDCAADLDGDGVVGVVDLLALLSLWGTGS